VVKQDQQKHNIQALGSKCILFFPYLFCTHSGIFDSELNQSGLNSGLWVSNMLIKLSFLNNLGDMFYIVPYSKHSHASSLVDLEHIHLRHQLG
jgi:hypothetical protein